KNGAHSLATINARPPRMTTITRAPAARGIGWSKGNDVQVSLPSRFMSPNPHWPHKRVFVARFHWARAWWELLQHDVVEQPGRHRTVGIGLDVRALLEQPAIGRFVQRRALAARGRRPGGELVGRDRVDLEAHAGEAVAAEHV